MCWMRVRTFPKIFLLKQEMGTKFIIKLRVVQVTSIIHLISILIVFYLIRNSETGFVYLSCTVYRLTQA